MVKLTQKYGKPLKQQALIDKFIANNPRIQLSDNKFEYEDPTANNEKESLSDSVFTETMAKIYIKYFFVCAVCG